MSLRRGSTGSSAADCDVRDPDEQAANDDRRDQYRQHGERGQVVRVRKFFTAGYVQQHAQRAVHPLGHVSGLADDERSEHPPADQRDNDVQRDQSDLLHFTSEVTPHSLHTPRPCIPILVEFIFEGP